MFMAISNEPIKVAHLQKLTNQSIVNGALVIETVNNSFYWKQEKLWLFNEVRNVLIEKILDFTIHLSYPEVQKNRKVDNA